jgi:uncharacterized protein (TIGR02145 family)
LKEFELLIKIIMKPLFKPVTIIFAIICCVILLGSCNKNEVVPDTKWKFETFTDARDGIIYKSKTIGTQTWMAENLKYLPTVNLPGSNSETEPLYYVYDYTGIDVNEAKAASNYTTFGVLYNWVAAMDACPAGWHLPTVDEWDGLKKYLLQNGFSYGVKKDSISRSLAATSAWEPSKINGTPGYDLTINNSSFFSAIPGGYRYIDGTFSSLGYSCFCWSSPEESGSAAMCWWLGHNSEPNWYNFNTGAGFSVRCLKN